MHLRDKIEAAVRQTEAAEDACRRRFDEFLTSDQYTPATIRRAMAVRHPLYRLLLTATEAAWTARRARNAMLDRSDNYAGRDRVICRVVMQQKQIAEAAARKEI